MANYSEQFDVQDFVERQYQLDFIKACTPDGSGKVELNFGCAFCADGRPDNFALNNQNGLWHCKKCDASGNLISLGTQLCDLGHITKDQLHQALAELREQEVAGKSDKLRDILKKGKGSDRPAATTTPPAGPTPEVIATLNEVMAFCRSKFDPTGRDEPEAKLKPEIIDHFKIGIVPPELAQHLKSKGFDLKKCAELGLLREKDGVAVTNYAGCVVTPWIVAGEVHNLEYRVDGEKRSLKGLPRVLFNVDAIKDGEVVFLVEAASDTMAIHEHGIEAVAGVPGATIFKPEWATFFEKVTTVIVIFDNDEAGAKGRKKVRQVLKNKRLMDVHLPQQLNGTDINDIRDFFGAGGSRDDLLALVKEADAASHTEADDEEPAANGTITRNGINYQVRNAEQTDDGFKAIVSVLDGSGDSIHTDRVSLFLAKKRAEFAKAVATAIEGVDPHTVKKDLQKIEKMLQEEAAEAEAKAKKAAKAKSKPKVPKEIKDAALAMLRSPHLAAIIVLDITLMGHVGELIGKLLVYLVATSRKMKQPLQLLIQGRSTAGKSSVGDKVIDMMPPEDVVDATSFSEQALANGGEDFVRHKLLRIGEVIKGDHMVTQDYYIRELLSRGKVTRYATVKTEDDKGFEVKEVTTEGPVALIQTTTHSYINEENFTRMGSYWVDESEAQTSKIHREQRRARTAAAFEQAGQQEVIKEIHQALQRMLKPYKVIIPYAEIIEFPTLLRTRRDHDRFLNLIEASAFLHQKQRRRGEIDGVKVVYASPADYRIARDITNNILANSLSDIAAPAIRLFEAMHEARRNGKLSEPFKRKDVKAALGKDWSQRSIERNLKELAERHELVEVTKEARGNVGAEFKLVKTKIDQIAGLKTFGQLVMKRPGFWKKRPVVAGGSALDVNLDPPSGRDWEILKETADPDIEPWRREQLKALVA
ncbi:MAG: hypothetical protein GY809_29970 [Planctomycetes bacterium]|nr:hypothetical protein [Planctomycetota bacterium]